METVGCKRGSRGQLGGYCKVPPRGGDGTELEEVKKWSSSRCILQVS